MATHQPGQAGVTMNRSISAVGTTNASAAITAAAGKFNDGDVGQAITGTGIPGGTTILSVTPTGNGATMSANATATGTVTAAIGGADGRIFATGEIKKKTNDTALGATGVESPFGVLGGTIADQQTRGVVDTINQTNVGAASGPDTEAPRVWT